MSRMMTRSKATTTTTNNMFTTSNDENAAPSFFKASQNGQKQGLSKQNVSKQSKPTRRGVLSDISNRQGSVNQEDRMAKKKRATTTETHYEKVAPLAPVETDASATLNLKSELADVDMKSHDIDLEASVADLRLDPVDAADLNNPQMVSEYINDIMAYLKRSEARRHPSASYMSKQRDINPRMREILIDWLVEVHFKFKLVTETLYLTINIIDRFLERRAVSRTKLQLVGCTAMLIASKYEEIYAPEVCDFVYISDRAYNREQILAMESIMLNTLAFHLTVPSALRFGERFCKVSGLTSRQSHLVNYLMELTCQEYKFMKYLPSLIASSAVYLAKTMTEESEVWTPILESHTNYSEDDLESCVVELYELSGRQPSKYRAVRKKYANRKFDEVANIPVVKPVRFASASAIQADNSYNDNDEQPE